MNWAAKLTVLGLRSCVLGENVFFKTTVGNVMMKSIFIFIILAQIALATSAQSIIMDDFADGNFTDSPSWSGETTDFMVNPSFQLQLSALPEDGQSFLVTQSDIIEEAEWSFFIQLDFNPSSNNFMDIYLISDQESLENRLNGFFVRIGTTQDDVSLYLQSGEKSEATKIIDGEDDLVDVSQVAMNIKVSKNHENEWNLLVDPNLDSNYVSQGTFTLGTNFSSKYFGILCNYSSTRSDKFFFDDLHITGKAHSDNQPPVVDSVVVLSDSTLQINFTENISEPSANNPSNYSVDNGIANPKLAILTNGNSVLLTFEKKFSDKIMHQISMNGLEDLYSNVMPPTDISFTYVAPQILGFGDILITEIMADPTPEVDLPEHEYLEIHNPHEEHYELNQVKLIVGNDTTTIPDLTINPDEYIILCASAAVEHLAQYGRPVKVSNWPSLNNRGERISLLNHLGGLVFSVEYKDTWYKSIDKDDGGWSLEMIDVYFPCKGEENWAASEDASGGTPGKENSIKEPMTDLSAPEITKIIAATPTSAIVYLSEKIIPQDLESMDFSIIPEVQISGVELKSPELNEIALNFHESVLPKTVYTLTAKNLQDCAGNVQKETSGSFVLPERADSLDILINEILFNPLGDGVDFVELYNISDKYIDLKDLLVGNETSKPIIYDHFILEPTQYLALTENPGKLQNQYPGVETKNILEVEDLPAFNNDEGDVFIADPDGKMIDFFHYSEDFHSGFLRDVDGVSLERIAFESPTNSPDNWQSAASTSGFATPGSVNSQHMNSNSEGEEIVVFPKTFAPGNSGYANFTTIQCRFPNNGNMASIMILDASGRKIKSIISHKSIGAKENFKWEGLDDNSQQVRMGAYIVYVEVYNTSGFRKLYRKKVVVGGNF